MLNSYKSDFFFMLMMLNLLIFVNEDINHKLYESIFHKVKCVSKNILSFNLKTRLDSIFLTNSEFGFFY